VPQAAYPVPGAFDVTKPHPYDYYLWDKDHWQADKEAADKILCVSSSLSEQCSVAVWPNSGRAQSAWTAAPHSGQRNGRRWATARQMA
jgi:hypothetical protein